MFYKILKNKNFGFSLLELILAVAIFSFSSFALSTMLIDSNISTKLNTERTEALFYAKEGIEAVRSIRDNDWDDLVDGEWGLAINEQGFWNFYGSSETIDSTDSVNDDKYTRTVTISDGIDDNNKAVSVNVAWDLTPSRIASTTLSTIFSNWIAVVNSSILTEGLVSYWSFDDGNADDNYGENDGVVGAGAIQVDGISGGAYLFSNSLVGDEINGSDEGFPSGSSASSVSLWIKSSSISGDSGIFAYGTPSSSGCRGISAIGPTTIRLYGWGSDVDISVPNMADNNWHHLVYIYNGTQVILYFDGQYINTAARSWSTVLNKYKIGANLNDGFNNLDFGGIIDEVFIYDRALTAEEIQFLYNSSKPN